MNRSPADVASLVDGARQGDEQALAAAARVRRTETPHRELSSARAPGQTLQVTALVHDATSAFCRIRSSRGRTARTVFGIAARSMRQIRGHDETRVEGDTHLTRQP